MNKEEKTVSNRLIYEGKNIKVYKQEIITTNGHKSVRDIVRHKGACTVIADINESILFIKQYRKAIDKVIYELPAGCIEQGEDIYECAKRELNEETGYEASELVLLSSVYTTPGFSDEVIHIFYAKDVVKAAVKKEFDIDEYIDVVLIEKSKVMQMILSGQIEDAKSICAYFLYLNKSF